MMNPQYMFKFIIVGNSAVGKSCLLLRLDEDKFQAIHDVTVGVTFSVRMKQIEGHNVKVQIWDTAGQEIFHSIIRSYYRDSNCAIIVYDITDEKSFEKVGDWVNDVRNLAPPDCLFVLWGNKIDLAEKRVIEKSRGQQFADEHNLLFFETSAATGQNVEKAFSECVTAVYQRAKQKNSGQTEANVSLEARSNDDDKCKC